LCRKTSANKAKRAFWKELDNGTAGAKLMFAVSKRQSVNIDVLIINPPFALFTPQSIKAERLKQI
jgi:hypothetical protein